MGIPFFGGRNNFVPQSPYLGVTLATFANGTFSRSSSGRYLTSASTVATASDNVLRLENRGDGYGSIALLEGARTNALSYSRATGSWTQNAPNHTGTNDYGVAPDGTTTAGRALKQTTASWGPSHQQIALSAGSSVAFSFWMSSNGGTSAGNSFRLGVDYNNGIAVKSTIPVGWTYFTATGTTTNNNPSTGLDHRANLPSTGDPAISTLTDVLLWGVQVETGVLFSSSTIASAGTPTTRSADVLTLTTAQYNAALRSVPWTTNVYPLFANTDTTAGDAYWLYSFGGSSDGIYLNNTGGNVTVIVKVGGSTALQSSTITFSKHQQLTITVRPAAGSLTVSGATSGNGTVIGSSFSFPSSTLRVGGILSANNEAFCRISQPVGV